MAPSKPRALSEWDLHDPAFATDPYPLYRDVRQACPVLHNERYGGFWLLTRYRDVREAALDWRRFTSSVAGVTAIPIITRRTEPQLPIELDPPHHARYRSLVAPVFSNRRLDDMRPVVQAIAAGLLDDLLARGEGELVGDYAVPLTVRTLAAFTGLPTEDGDRWVGWIRRMFDVRDPEDAQAATAEFGAYIDALIAARRAAPRDDFIGLLMASEVEGQRLTDEEIHAFLTLTFGAGFETTADAISAMLYLLAEHSEQGERLKAEPSLIPAAVEEYLRFVSPIQIFGRNATEDVRLHGHTIPEGAVVALGFGAANRDPDAFPDPDACVLDRSPNRYLAFGWGPHYCLGAPVAKLEMAVTLEAFVHRVARLEVARGETGAAEWKTRGDRRGMATLRVTATPP